MIEVIVPDIEMQNFLEDRQEVGERADRRERWRICGARQAPGCSENECVLNRVDRHSTLMQLSGEQTIGAADDTACARRGTISSEDPANILASVHASQPCGSRSEGPLIVTVWQ
jgi:hypothetical protein